MMEAIMSRSSDNYLQEVIDLLKSNAQRQDKRMDNLESKLDANTTTTNQVLQQAKYTNGRVTKLEKSSTTLSKRISIIQKNKTTGFLERIESKTLYMMALIAAILLAIIANVAFHIHLENFL